jgi:N-acyl-phosphatidylethanolamine-hydrolysing phospholipase D
MSVRSPRIPKNIQSLIPKQTPTWGAQHGNGHNGKATWLGYVSGGIVVLDAETQLLCVDSHASYFVELPTPPGAARGVRIIVDPVFSKRCFPYSFLGPVRFTGKALAPDAPARSHVSPSHALKMHLAKLKTSLPSMLLCFRYVSSSR